MDPIIDICALEKTYDDGFQALKGVDLSIREGEILALLGPNGAGKTTLISAVCGLVTPTGGSVTVGGHDILTEYRKARALIGLVPQDVNIQPFEKVMNTVRFSRGLFGCPPDPDYLERVLRSLTLWEKRNSAIKELSGGMKRRVLIAKALAHEPRILFLDEPTAGVDVTLRREMWALVRELRERGTTIILTTHYLEEAEEMADRIGVINGGQMLLIEEKAKLMRKLGRKELTIELSDPLERVPDSLAHHGLELSEDGRHLSFEFDATAERTGMTRLLADIAAAGLRIRDVSTRQSSLEEVFLRLVEDNDRELEAAQ